MTVKTTTAKFRYRIEQKADGGFVAHPEDPTMETLEGNTREELQQKMEEKFTSLVGDQIHKEFKIGGIDVKLNVVRKATLQPGSGTEVSRAQNNSGTNLASANSQLQFESSGNVWQVIALLVAIGAIVLYLIRR